MSEKTAKPAESQKPSEVQFRCPDDNGTEFKTGKKGEISCKACKREWAKKEVWQAFVLIRRFISPIDYDHYSEKAKK
jgi:hypothetical protein